MSVIYAIILGIIQGITEFLPVSSFGHLAALETMWGISRNTAVLFEVLLHVGTLAAVFAAFWTDILRIAEELIGIVMDLVGNLGIYIHNRRTGEQRSYAKIVYGTYRTFAASVAVSFLPTALLGFFARRLVTKAAISPILPGAGILITGVFLLVTDISGQVAAGQGNTGISAGNVMGRKTPKDVTWADAMWIGICQGISVFPGISRCAMTICAARLCGFGKKFAVKYSFIASIPAILGSLFLELRQFVSPGMTISLGFTYMAGVVAAAVVGFFVVCYLPKLLWKVRLRYFAFYCFLAGIGALAGNMLK